VVEIYRSSRSSSRGSSKLLEALIEEAYRSVEEGYYSVDEPAPSLHLDFKESILRCRKVPIIAEVKFTSPTYGVLKKGLDPVAVAEAMVEGGAVGLSVLTEPRYFKGSIEDFARIRRAVDTPLLMKDIVVSKAQIDGAAKVGADAILLIHRIFDEGKCESPLTEMVDYAHSKGMQILLETHSRREFAEAVGSEADIIGINNRDLETMRVDISTTPRILECTPKLGRLVVSESGIRSAEDVRRLKRLGVDAFLVGSSIMAAEDIAAKVRELVEAV